MLDHVRNDVADSVSVQVSRLQNVNLRDRHPCIHQRLAQPSTAGKAERRPVGGQQPQCGWMKVVTVDVGQQHQLQRPVFRCQCLERNPAINEDFVLDHHRISLTSGGYDVVVDHNELRSTTVSTVVGSP